MNSRNVHFLLNGHDLLKIGQKDAWGEKTTEMQFEMAN